jgi:hypothetical protein
MVSSMTFSLLEKLIQLFQPRASAVGLQKEFDRNRLSLERQFFETARTAGIPRGLRWVRCEWLPSQILLRDKTTSQPCLLVGVNVSFEAIEGGEMENVAAVSLIRDACAVFQFTPSGWTTGGRTLFNMNPEEAASKLGSSYEPFSPRPRGKD